MNIAIIKSGGKQYIVRAGDKLKLEKIKAETGKKVNFDTLFLANEKGDKIEVGAPSLGNKVEGKVLENGRGKKVKVVKYKSKTRYKVTTGHRQYFTEVEITKL